MKRVLIISYYWPPSGGSGVQRWLKMSKYLPQNGWQPVIYTTDEAEYPVEDLSLEQDVAPEAEVIRRPIVEPYTFYKRFVGIKQDNKVKTGFTNECAGKSKWKESLSIWIRGNMFIPDARCWWIKPSVKYLSTYLEEHPVDAIISTGPPHSMHLIGMKLHEKLHIPWIADFRDPWTEIDFYQDLKLTRFADKKHHRLEHKVLTKATKVISVGWTMSDGLVKLGAKNHDIIPNGYDLEINTEPMPQSDKFTISHIGVIPPNRNTECLWEALSEMNAKDNNFAKALEIKLIGQIDRSVSQSIEKYRLEKYTTHISYLSHDDAITEQQKASLLLLLLNNVPSAKGITTGKLFEYLAARRPILAIGPEDGDAAKILQETNAGKIADFGNKEKMIEILSDYFKDYTEGKLVSNSYTTEIEKYSRKNMAKEYCKILNDLTKEQTIVDK